MGKARFVDDRGLPAVSGWISSRVANRIEQGAGGVSWMRARAAWLGLQRGGPTIARPHDFGGPT